MTRTAVIFARLGPYHVARLRAAAKAVSGELLAIEVAAESREYQWERVASDGFKRRTVIQDRDYQETTGRFRSDAIIQVLEEDSPDSVAISGWGFAEARAALHWCRQRNRTAVIMSESQRHDAQRLWPKEAYKSWLVGQCDAALVGGRTHADYLAELGMDADRIAFGYDVVDNDHFTQGAEAALQRGDGERRRLGLPADYFLCSARFISKKNLLGLLEAYRDYRLQVGGRPWKLVLLGDGPLRANVESGVRRWALEPDVLLPGFKQYNDLPAFYAFAGAFVLPSRSEQWGLVVNEAMAAGVPALVSTACGSSVLVKDGQNGWVFDPAEPGALARRLIEIHRLGPALGSFGKAAKATIEEWGPERFGLGLAEALEAGDRYRVTMRSVGSRR